MTWTLPPDDESSDGWTPTPEQIHSLRPTLGPRFANDQQEEFFFSDAPEILYSGAFGAGKSRILCEKAHDLALSYPGIPIAIVRKVAASLPATTMQTYTKDVLIPSGVRVKRNKTERWFEYPNLSRIWFFGLDADPLTGLPSKVGSFDAAVILVDEAVELDEADWVMLQGRLRSQAAPYRQLGAATNPADPDHWLKKRFTPASAKRVYLHARTADNKLLPRDYIERVEDLEGIYRSRYAEGEWISVEGALWSMDDFLDYRPAPAVVVNGSYQPEYVRVVVGVDPAMSNNPHSDETGIIVAALGNDGRAYVLDDWSGQGSPDEWGSRVAQAYTEHHADLVVAEVNQGGDLVESNLRVADPNLPVKKVAATRGKALRAEPISRLYKLGKVSHVRPLDALQKQMVSFDPLAKKKSPDRLDALVYALTELLVAPGNVTNSEFSMIA